MGRKGTKEHDGQLGIAGAYGSLHIRAQSQGLDCIS
jgi:hypothetical protein